MLLIALIAFVIAFTNMITNLRLENRVKEIEKKLGIDAKEEET